MPAEPAPVLVEVERVAEDRWRIWPQDETWLSLLVQEVLGGNSEAVAAVIKEHPQHEGVLLRGNLREVLVGLGKTRARIEALAAKGVHALRCESFAEGNLVRRAVLTRPACLAAASVTFTEGVEDSEYEPMAAHRIGQLTFRVASQEQMLAAEARLVVPAGQMAFACHLELPAGVSLLPGEGDVCIGLRARAEPAGENSRLLALVLLRPGSVFRDKHAKFRATSAVSYRPEVRLSKPFPKSAAEIVRAAGFSLSASGVVGQKTFPVRAEYVSQLLPEASFCRPQLVEVDFSPLGLGSKEEVLRGTFRHILAEIDQVVSELAKDAPFKDQPSRCPDIPHLPRSSCTA